VHIAMLEDEVVHRRKWLSRDRFLDLLGATHLIPGPNSTEMAIHIGYARAGWAGLIVAGVCFICPAALMVTGLAAAYARYGSIPRASGVLYGIKPVVSAIVAVALWRLGRAFVRTPSAAGIGFLAAAATFAGANELVVLFAAGLLSALCSRTGGCRSYRPAFAAALLLGALAATAGVPAAPGPTFTLLRLFLFFLKVGSVLFGSGYVLLAFLEGDLVHRWGWLTETQLLDAIAAGQVTPGPVFTTATFVGYVLGGLKGAATATVGIFFPAFFFVAASGPLVPRLRRSPAAGAFLDGLNTGSVALVAAVAVRLARAALVDPPAIALALASGAALVRWNVNSAWLVAAGAITGFAFGSPSGR